MNLTNLGNIEYREVYTSGELKVMKRSDGTDWILYNFVQMPPGRIVEEINDGIVRHVRYGARFFSQHAAQNAFNALKQNNQTIKLKKSEL